MFRATSNNRNSCSWSSSLGQAGIAEGIALAPVLGPEQVLVGNAGLVAETPHLPDLLVQQLGEGLGALEGQSLHGVGVQVPSLIP